MLAAREEGEGGEHRNESRDRRDELLHLHRKHNEGFRLNHPLLHSRAAVQTDESGSGSSASESGITSLLHSEHYVSSPPIPIMKRMSSAPTSSSLSPPPSEKLIPLTTTLSGTTLKKKSFEGFKRKSAHFAKRVLTSHKHSHPSHEPESDSTASRREHLISSSPPGSCSKESSGAPSYQVESSASLSSLSTSLPDELKFDPEATPRGDGEGGLLEVVIHSARNLNNNVEEGLDAYCEVMLLDYFGNAGKKEKKKTKVVKDNSCPVWQETFLFDFDIGECSGVKIVCKDNHRFRDSSFLGHITISTTGLLNTGEKIERWFPLCARKKDKRTCITGDILVSISYISASEAERRGTMKIYKQEIAATKQKAVKKLKKYYGDQFHEKEEIVFDVFSCALRGKQGKLYVTSKYLYFCANILGVVTKLRISYADIKRIEKKKSVKLLPNAISIYAKNSHFFFYSFMHRERAYELIRMKKCTDLRNSSSSGSASETEEVEEDETRDSANPSDDEFVVITPSTAQRSIAQSQESQGCPFSIPRLELSKLSSPMEAPKITPEETSTNCNLRLSEPLFCSRRWYDNFETDISPIVSVLGEVKSDLSIPSFILKEESKKPFVFNSSLPSFKFSSAQEKSPPVSQLPEPPEQSEPSEPSLLTPPAVVQSVSPICERMNPAPALSELTTALTIPEAMERVGGTPRIDIHFPNHLNHLGLNCFLPLSMAFLICVWIIPGLHFTWKGSIAFSLILGALCMMLHQWSFQVGRWIGVHGVKLMKNGTNNKKLEHIGSAVVPVVLQLFVYLILVVSTSLLVSEFAIKSPLSLVVLTISANVLGNIFNRPEFHLGN